MGVRADDDGSSSASQLLTQGRDGVVRLWDLGEDGRLGGGESKGADGGALATVDTGSYSLCQLAAAPPLAGAPGGMGAVFAVASVDNGVAEVWDVRAPRAPAVRVGRAERDMLPAEDDPPRVGACTALSFAHAPSAQAGQSTPSLPLLLAGFESGDVRAYDLRKGSESLGATDARRAACGSAPFSQPVLSLATVMAAGGREVRCAAGGADTFGGALALTHGSSSDGGLNLASLGPLPGRAAGDIAATAFRGDGRCIAAGGWDGAVRLFDWKRRRPLARLRYHAQAVSEVAFCDGAGRTLASASRDGTVALWELDL